MVLVDGDKSGILEWDADRITKVHGEFDVIWANPPCKTFSVMGIRHHYNKADGSFKTEQARIDRSVLDRVLDIMDELDPELWFMENPVGKMGTLPITQDLPKYMLTYCQYGDHKMKPTNIWTNHPKPDFRAPCKKGQPCHTASKKGMRSTINKEKTNLIKQLPGELVEHIHYLCGSTTLRFNFDHVESPS